MSKFGLVHCYLALRWLKRNKYMLYFVMLKERGEEQGLNHISEVI